MDSDALIRWFGWTVILLVVGWAFLEWREVEEPLWKVALASAMLSPFIAWVDWKWRR